MQTTPSNSNKSNRIHPSHQHLQGCPPCKYLPQSSSTTSPGNASTSPWVHSLPAGGLVPAASSVSVTNTLSRQACCAVEHAAMLLLLLLPSLLLLTMLHRREGVASCTPRTNQGSSPLDTHLHARACRGTTAAKEAQRMHEAAHLHFPSFRKGKEAARGPTGLWNQARRPGWWAGGTEGQAGHSQTGHSAEACWHLTSAGEPRAE